MPLLKLYGSSCLFLSVALGILLAACATPASMNSPLPAATVTPLIAIQYPNMTALAATETALPNPRATNVAFNLQELDSLTATPFPTPLAKATDNETEIIPGISTEQQVLALAGGPSATFPAPGGVYWSFNKSPIRELNEVVLIAGVVSKITLQFRPVITLDEAVQKYGPPEMVGFESLPANAQHPSPPGGYLLYPSRGMHLYFFCTPSEPCPGLRRNASALYQYYFVPMNLREWVMSQDAAGDIRIEPWHGFDD